MSDRGFEGQRAVPAEVVEYDDAWPIMYAEIAMEVSRALDVIDHEVLHIGSTAVPGLAAKPVIDVFAVLNSPRDIDSAISALGNHGWLHEGDGSIPGREMFTVRHDLPYHHLYLVVRDSEQHRLQIRFRDILRQAPRARAEYATLKIKLAPLLKSNRAAYTDGKTEFIESVLRRR